MKKILLNIISKFANNIYYENKYDVRLINNKPFIFKFCHDDGIAGLLMYRVLWLFYIPFIEINDAFYSFEDDEQEFILQHEFAHYKFKHYEWYYQYLSDEEANELEIHADLYAMIKTNKDVALRALNKLEDICNNMDVDTKYIRERILQIEKYKERAK